MPVSCSIKPEKLLMRGHPKGWSQIDMLQAHRVLRFGAVGAFVCGVDVALVWLFSRFVAPALAVSMAYILAVTVHFSLNKWWVFENRDGKYARQLWRYGLTVLACWLCTLLFFSTALRFVTAYILVAKIIAIPPTTLLGFVMMRGFVFRSSKS